MVIKMLRELWDKEERRLAAVLITRVVQERDKVCSKDISNGNYPDVFQIYVKNQAVKIFNEEKPIRLHNLKRYNLESDQIKNHFRVLRDNLIGETFFTKQEITRMILFVVKVQYEALVRPRQSMGEMLYKANEQLNKKEVLAVLYGFGDDRPFLQKLISSIESFSSEIVTRNNLNELAIGLEKEVYKEKPVSTFMRDLILLNKFEASITSKGNPNVASEVLLGMLKERGLNRIADGLKDETLGKDYWAFEEVENALERHFLVGELEPLKLMTKEMPPAELEFTTNNETETSDRFDEFEIDLENEIAVEQESNIDIESGSVGFDYVEEETEKKADTEVVCVEEETEKRADTEVENLQYSQPEKLKKIIYSDPEDTVMINRRDIERQPPGPYPSLKTLINKRDQKLFIKKIFSKGRQRYLEFIEHLENQDKWKNAKAIINTELDRRAMDHYSKEALLLGDIVFSRYFSKNHAAKR